MLTARDLLYKSLDYDGFWNSSKKMLQSQPSQCRKAQLDILLKAFGILKGNAKALSQVPYTIAEGKEVVSIYASSKRAGSMHRMEYITTLTEFQYFSTGEFLADLDTKVYRDLQDKIITAAKAIFPEQAGVIDSQLLNLVRLFSALYSYRLLVHHMLRHGGSKITDTPFSLEDAYSLHLQSKFMETMTGSLTDLDETICMLLDPVQKNFSEDELDFPVYDFAAIDAEWERGLRKPHR